MDNYLVISIEDFNKVFQASISKESKLIWIYGKYLQHFKRGLPPAERISEDLNICLPHVRHSLKRLKELGFVSSHKAGANNEAC